MDDAYLLTPGIIIDLLATNLKKIKIVLHQCLRSGECFRPGPKW